MGHIYKIVNVVTEDFYVGSAVKEKRRKWEHWTALKKGMHHCMQLQTAWDEFGEDAFEFILVEEVPDARLLEVEDTYLALNAGQPHCYNTALSTQITSSTQNSVRQKIGISLRQLYGADPKGHPRYGKKHSNETKAKISASKLANPCRPWLGKVRSEETKKKVGDAQRGIKKGPRTYTPEGLERARENMRRHAKQNTPADFSAVLAKFPKEVQDRYDFSFAVYTGALKRITGCLCPKHGNFSQYAAQFRKGRGCPQCGAEQRAQSKKTQMLQAWVTPEGRKVFMEKRRNTVDNPPPQE